VRTLFLCLLCIACVVCAVKECPDRHDLRKVAKHAALGLVVALTIWWILAYEIEIFSGYSGPKF
jgi:hypothetical protein